MKGKANIKWLVGGACLGIILGIVTSKDLFEEETRYTQSTKKIEVEEIRNTEGAGVKEKDKLVKTFFYDRDIEYSDLTYEDGVLFFKSYLFNISDNMQINSYGDILLDGEKVSWGMEIDGKFYGVVPGIESSNHTVKDNKIITKKGEEELDIFLMEFNIDNEDKKLREVGREEKTYSEYIDEKDISKYDKFYSSEVKEYKSKNFENVGEELKKAEKITKKKYGISHNEHLEVFNSDDRYYMVVGYTKNADIVYILGDRKEGKEYVFQPSNEKLEVKSMFYYNDKIFAADRFGNILEVKIDGDKAEIIELSENTVRKKNQGEFHMLGMEEGFVYFRNYLPVDSLIAYDIENEKFSVVYESQFKTMDGIDMKDGYISLYIEPGKRAQKIVGKLKGDKIEVILDEVEYLKGSRDFVYEDTLIMEALDETPNSYGTVIKIYDLK